MGDLNVREPFHRSCHTYEFDEFIKRDTASLDIFRFRDEGLEESDHLSDADVLAQELVD